MGWLGLVLWLSGLLHGE
uniref:Uncharacterized protein n=1 Tax=Anguilla anguilla TaxID=7936 RepID=A0A0E9QPL0_ANGAN